MKKFVFLLTVTMTCITSVKAINDPFAEPIQEARHPMMLPQGLPVIAEVENEGEDAQVFQGELAANQEIQPEGAPEINGQPPNHQAFVLQLQPALLPNEMEQGDLRLQHEVNGHQ